MATNDELKNQQDLNKAKKETNNLQSKGNQYSDKAAADNSKNLDFTRQLNAELRDQLGVKQKLSDQDKTIRNLGNEVVRNVQQNSVELGNTNKIEREIVNQTRTRSALLTEIASLTSNAITKGSDKVLVAAEKLSIQLLEQKKIQDQILDTEKEIADYSDSENDQGKKILQTAESRLKNLNKSSLKIESTITKLKTQNSLLGSLNNDEIDRLGTVKTLSLIHI